MKPSFSSNFLSGPGVIITGAFIGPGTVTVCLLAGVKSGVSLLWAVLFSTFATIILQDMVVRLAVREKRSLEEIFLSRFTRPWLKGLFALFIFTAIIVGNTAYQSGNLAGTSLGVALLFEEIPGPWIVFGVAVVCLFIFTFNNTQQFRQILGMLVAVMSLTFIALAMYFMPGPRELLRGLLIPSLMDDQLMLALGLVGTTVVPYNLFLHSALVYNAGEGELKALRTEGAISILMGGLISLAIVITGKIGEGSTIANAADMATVLKNNMGSASLWLFGTGLFAAGFSSALTAPMAAGKVASGLWQHFFLSQKRLGFWIEVAVVILGAWVAIANVNNLWVIKTAQVINGMLLPVFIIMILYLLNTRTTMKKNKNNIWLNLAGFFVLLVSILLTYKTLVSVFS